MSFPVDPARWGRRDLRGRTGSRCHRHDVELAEDSEDVIDWRLVHRTRFTRRRMRPGSSARAAQGGEALDASPRPAARALVNPSRSATVTVSAEWPLRRSGDGTFSAKWMQTPASWFVPKLRPSSTMEPRTPNAVHQR